MEFSIIELPNPLTSRRTEGGLRLNRLWTLSALRAGEGLFRPHMHPVPMLGTFVLATYNNIIIKIFKGAFS